MDQNTASVVVATLALIGGVINALFTKSKAGGLTARIIVLEDMLADCLQSNQNLTGDK